jgi:GT2 family glycosyltransferase
MSVYAREQPALLERALRSVAADQTLPADEIVVVEDGPLTPELYAVLDGFPALRRVPLPVNMGLGKALNAGLEHCRNEWVARMDSDDIALPERFERQMKYLEKHPEIDVLGCALSEFESDPAVVTATKSCPADVSEYIKFRSPVNHATVFFRKSAVQAAGGYLHCHFMEDYHLWIRMHAAGMRLTSLPEALYLCKMDAGTQRRRGGWKYVRSEMEIQKLLHRSGLITLPRRCLNVALRGSARLIPGSLRAWLYRTLLR